MDGTQERLSWLGASLGRDSVPPAIVRPLVAQRMLPRPVVRVRVCWQGSSARHQTARLCVAPRLESWSSDTLVGAPLETSCLGSSAVPVRPLRQRPTGLLRKATAAFWGESGSQAWRWEVANAIEGGSPGGPSIARPPARSRSGGVTPVSFPALWTISGRAWVVVTGGRADPRRAARVRSRGPRTGSPGGFLFR